MSSASNLHIDEIVNQGYTRIEGFLDFDEVSTGLEKLEVLRNTTQAVEDEYLPRLDKGSRGIYNLQNKDIWFLDIFTEDSRLMPILRHFLNDPFYKQIPQNKANFILRSMGARTSSKPLPLHIDSMFPYVGSNVITMQAILFLEESNEETGCSLVIPGSHNLGLYAREDMIGQAIPLTAKPGDLVVWDGRIIHGTKSNTSNRTRWSIVATMARWWLKQQYRITEAVPETILKDCSREQMTILGFDSVPGLTEYDKVDIKIGYV